MNDTDLSDPQRAPGRTPPRAEPLQPDWPPQGLDNERPDGPPVSERARKDLAEQERAAHENTREGYGG